MFLLFRHASLLCFGTNEQCGTPTSDSLQNFDFRSITEEKISIIHYKPNDILYLDILPNKTYTFESRGQASLTLVHTLTEKNVHLNIFFKNETLSVEMTDPKTNLYGFSVDQNTIMHTKSFDHIISPVCHLSELTKISLIKKDFTCIFKTKTGIFSMRQRHFIIELSLNHEPFQELSFTDENRGNSFPTYFTIKYPKVGHPTKLKIISPFPCVAKHVSLEIPEENYLLDMSKVKSYDVYINGVYFKELPKQTGYYIGSELFGSIYGLKQLPTDLNADDLTVYVFDHKETSINLALYPGIKKVKFQRHPILDGFLERYPIVITGNGEHTISFNDLEAKLGDAESLSGCLDLISTHSITPCFKGIKSIKKLICTQEQHHYLCPFIKADTWEVHIDTLVSSIIDYGSLIRIESIPYKVPQTTLFLVIFKESSAFINFINEDPYRGKTISRTFVLPNTTDLELSGFISDSYDQATTLTFEATPQAKITGHSRIDSDVDYLVLNAKKIVTDQYKEESDFCLVGNTDCSIEKRSFEFSKFQTKIKERGIFILKTDGTYKNTIDITNMNKQTILIVESYGGNSPKIITFNGKKANGTLIAKNIRIHLNLATLEHGEFINSPITDMGNTVINDLRSDLPSLESKICFCESISILGITSFEIENQKLKLSKNNQKLELEVDKYNNMYLYQCASIDISLSSFDNATQSYFIDLSTCLPSEDFFQIKANFDQIHENSFIDGHGIKFINIPDGLLITLQTENMLDCIITWITRAPNEAIHGFDLAEEVDFCFASEPNCKLFLVKHRNSNTRKIAIDSSIPCAYFKGDLELFGCDNSCSLMLSPFISGSLILHRLYIHLAFPFLNRVILHESTINSPFISQVICRDEVSNYGVSQGLIDLTSIGDAKSLSIKKETIIEFPGFEYRIPNTYTSISLHCDSIIIRTTKVLPNIFLTRVQKIIFDGTWESTKTYENGLIKIANASTEIVNQPAQSLVYFNNLYLGRTTTEYEDCLSKYFIGSLSCDYYSKGTNSKTIVMTDAVFTPKEQRPAYIYGLKKNTKLALRSASLAKSYFFKNLLVEFDDEELPSFQGENYDFIINQTVLIKKLRIETPADLGIVSKHPNIFVRSLIVDCLTGTIQFYENRWKLRNQIIGFNQTEKLEVRVNKPELKLEFNSNSTTGIMIVLLNDTIVQIRGNQEISVKPPIKIKTRKMISFDSFNESLNEYFFVNQRKVISTDTRDNLALMVFFTILAVILTLYAYQVENQIKKEDEDFLIIPEKEILRNSVIMN